MRSKKIIEFEPKHSKVLTMKIIVSNGNASRLVKELPAMKPRGVKVKMLGLLDNTIEMVLSTSKPDIFAFLLKSARFSIANGIMFKAVFKDDENTPDWCGYYETNKTSALEGSRFTNVEKLNRMIQTYFPIYI